MALTDILTCTPNCWKFGENVMNKMIRFLGYLLLMTGSCIVAFIFSVYFIVYLPRSNNVITSAASFFDEYHYSLTIEIIIGLFLLINIVFNYYMAFSTDPGSPTTCTDPERVLGQRETHLVDGRKIFSIKYQYMVAPYVYYKYCRHCECIKPPRCHHCSVTNKCILEMDHFCPWINNVVGYYNYRYFVLFLLYVFISSVYMLVSMIQEVVGFKPFLNRTIYGFLIISSSITFALFIAVGFLLATHIYLIITNQTTIEVYENYEWKSDALEHGEVFKNPYDKGWRKNLRRIFGDHSIMLSLLPSTRMPIEPDYPFEFVLSDYSKFNVSPNKSRYGHTNPNVIYV